MAKKYKLKVEGTLEVDSREEYEFAYWLIEAKKKGWVTDWTAQPKTFVLMEDPVYETITVVSHLKTKKKVVSKKQRILEPVVYTPDFKFKVTEAFRLIFGDVFHKPDKDGFIWVDVKGSFHGKNNTSAETFPIKQKWLYCTTGLFVQKLVPLPFFKKTWLPYEASLTAVKRDTQKKYLDNPTKYPLLEARLKLCRI